MSRSQHLSILYILSALSAVSFAAPKPQNWDTIDWAHVVDWKTVNYGNAQAKPVPKTTHVQGQPTTTTIYHQPPTTTTASSSTSVPPAKPSPTQVSNSGAGKTGSSGSKRGLVYNGDSPALDIFSNFPSISWGWSWSARRLDLPSQYEFVPMLWGPDKYQEFQDNFPSGASHILSFNEPDHPDQANLAIGDCVSKHIDLLKPYVKNGVKVGAVSVTNGNSTLPGAKAPVMGLEYLSEFLDQCSQRNPPCAIDFCPVHWYGCTNGCGVDTDLAKFKEDMTAAVGTCKGKPVWITEFQKIGSEPEQQDFVKKAIDWLESPEQAAIERYSYFMVKDGIMTNGGSLNSVGTAYASA